MARKKAQEVIDGNQPPEVTTDGKTPPAAEAGKPEDRVATLRRELLDMHGSGVPTAGFAAFEAKLDALLLAAAPPSKVPAQAVDDEFYLTAKDRLFLRTAVSLLVKGYETAIKKAAEVDAVVQVEQLQTYLEYCQTTLAEKIRKGIHRDMERDPEANTRGLPMFDADQVKAAAKEGVKEGVKEVLEEAAQQAEPEPMVAEVEMVGSGARVLSLTGGSTEGGTRLLGPGETATPE